MAYQLNKIKFLIVEDNSCMLELISSILETLGATNIVRAKNGEEGFELYQKENPDLIIADFMMQPIDGLVLTKKIRNEVTGPNKFVPIILTTGFSDKKRVMEARDSGVTEFLVKPFNVRDLYRRITQVVEKPRQFVRSEDFFGPDRRRSKKAQQYAGPYRRETDSQEQSDIQNNEHVKDYEEIDLVDIAMEDKKK